MTRKIKSLLAACLLATLLPASVMAQDKQLTLHDLVPGGRTYNKFVPRNLKQLQWYGDTYIYAKGDSLLSAIPAKPNRWR